MTWLSPLGLLWLGAIPVLLWLWRLASSNRQTRVASLIPFEHLLKRTSTRRRRLAINWLFWLQLAALTIAAVALAQPTRHVTRAKTILAILDTSASMAARSPGSSAFDRAKSALFARLARKAPTDQVLLLTTAPTMPLTTEPTSDGTTLARLMDAQYVRDLGGQLATTARLGQALLGRAPDETWVATDEPLPAGVSSPALRWMGVGRSLPNIAIVGADALGPLCDASEAHVVVTIQSFSDAPARVRLTARQQNRQLAQALAELAPTSRQAVVLPLPHGTHGIVEVILDAAPDALDVDNRAWVVIQPAARLPVVLRTSRAQVTATVSRWLSACTALTWTAEPAPLQGNAVLITDREEDLRMATGPVLMVRPPAGARPAVSHWMISPDHPIGFYLSPLETVAASITAQPTGTERGTPVISAFIDGRKTPIVLADELNGRRTVEWRVDVSGQETSTPITLVFFNSLRWLMGDLQPATTRDGLATDGWAPGPVTIRYPDGSTRRQPSIDGIVRDDAATQIGVYRFTQGSRDVSRVVNFLDSLESNTLDRTSTWGRSNAEAPASRTVPSRASSHPLAPTLMLVIMVLLVGEWWMYSAKRPASRAPGR